MGSNKRTFQLRRMSGSSIATQKVENDNREDSPFEFFDCSENKNDESPENNDMPLNIVKEENEENQEHLENQFAGPVQKNELSPEGSALENDSEDIVPEQHGDLTWLDLNSWGVRKPSVKRQASVPVGYREKEHSAAHLNPMYHLSQSEMEGNEPLDSFNYELDQQDFAEANKIITAYGRFGKMKKEALSTRTQLLKTASTEEQSLLSRRYRFNQMIERKMTAVTRQRRLAHNNYLEVEYDMDRAATAYRVSYNRYVEQVPPKN